MKKIILTINFLLPILLLKGLNFILFSNISVLLNDYTVLNNAYVGTSGSLINYIGTEKPSVHFGTIYNGKDKLLIPGFINTHCHVPMTLLRGLGTDLNLFEWLKNAVFPAEKKLKGEYIYWGSLLGIAEMLRSGVTSFNDMYYFCDFIVKACVEAEIKANISHSISVFDDKNPYETDTFKTAVKLFKDYNNANDSKIKIDMCLHSEYTTNSEMVRAVSEFSKENDANIQLHLSETKKENDECIEKYKMSPTEYFNSFGLFENRTTAAHCIFLSEKDIEIIKEKNVTVAHCPISNLKLGSGIANINYYLQKGINVTLGTDGCASNDNLNFLEDIKTMALLQKGINLDASAMPLNTVLKIASKNAAASQGRFDTGSIEVGNKADLAVVSLKNINMLPASNLIGSLVYSSTPSDIDLTMVDGKVLYKENNFLTIDIEKVTHHVKQIKKKLYN